VEPIGTMTKLVRHAKRRLSRNEVAFRPAPAIVLVEPQLGENIGAVARAMLNFGLSELLIVNPRDGWPNEKAVAMASGASLVLERARLAASTAIGLSEFDYALAMTARPRESLLPVFSPRAATEEMRRRIDAGGRCAIMLGAERAGLSNEDVGRADGVVSIPVNPAFASLNIAQAAVVMAYEWAIADGRAPAPSDLDLAPQATKAQFEGFVSQLFKALDERRYFFPPEKRQTMERKLKTIFARAALREGEVRTLRGVVKVLTEERLKD
jgi:tRNA/rRNA methyltransferase